MSRALLLSVARSKTCLIAFACLCLCRLGQLATFPADGLAGTSAEEGYSLVNGLGYACFVFVPLYGFVLARALGALRGAALITRRGSRASVALGQLACSLELAFLWAAAIGATSLPFVLLNYGAQPGFASYAVLSLLLQAAFLTACAMLFALVLAASRLAAAAFVAMALYGMWDFMASNVVGGGVPYIGWGRAFVATPAAWPDIASSVALPLAITCLLLCAALAVASRADFLPRQGA